MLVTLLVAFSIAAIYSIGRRWSIESQQLFCSCCGVLILRVIWIPRSISLRHELWSLQIIATQWNMIDSHRLTSSMVWKCRGMWFINRSNVSCGVCMRCALDPWGGEAASRRRFFDVNIGDIINTAIVYLESSNRWIWNGLITSPSITLFVPLRFLVSELEVLLLLCTFSE